MQDQWCCGQCNNEANLREALFSFKRCFFAHAIEIHYQDPLWSLSCLSLFPWLHWPTLSFWLDFPGGSDGKASAYNVGDPGLIPGSGRSSGEGNGPHSSILAWKIPWTEEHGRLQPMGSQRVRHDWATSFSFLLVSLCPGTRSITSPITTYCISVFMSVSPLDFKYFEDKVLWFFCVSSSL